MEVVPSTPQDSVQNRVEEQIADSSWGQLLKSCLLRPQESVQNRTHEQIVDSVHVAKSSSEAFRGSASAP